LKELIEVESSEVDNVVNEGYNEFLIENFDNIWYYYSPQFQIGGYDWTIEVRSKNEYTNFDHISLFLKNLNDNCAKVKFVFSVRNYQDYFYFIAKEYSKLQYYDLQFEPHGFSQFINKTELYSKSDENDKSIVENDKIVVGVYVQVYKEDTIIKEKEEFINKVKNIANFEKKINSNIEEGFYEFIVSRFKEIDNNEKKYFKLDENSWSLVLNANNKMNYKEFISLYIKNNGKNVQKVKK